MKHPTWYVRYVVVHPKGSELFGPLQACYESRQIWRKKYDDTRGYMDLEGLRGISIRARVPDKLRFDMPWICYETDIFTVSKAWNKGHTSDRGQSYTFLHCWDPFLYLDRTRIKHAGLRLDPGIKSGRPGWVQMSPLVLQRDFHFELRDISPSQLEHHPMFRDYLISRRSTTGRLDRPLRHLVPWTKAWLWHSAHCGEAMDNDVFLEDLGPDYMMDPSGWAGRPGPLDLPGCQSEQHYMHSQRDIWDWNPR
ncbi:hypothetical protein F5144DRAFT_547437 [Chaetomium tenue]|uniref:Uncharacterized protein n=1 Tax=Chaetomium tenue TaxID=1854479 RepID=A0ACB7P5F3_9PEZI|nr:hypothetical protein F5144DRAFT_547437 [Chaetomium globosum]